MNTFAIGDIHGRIKALKEVLKKAKFDYEKDKLIILGDVCDGGYNTYEVVEELLKINNKVFIMGNHDEWFLNHIKNGWADEIWVQQGGANTLTSYGANVKVSNRVSKDSFINTQDLKIPVTHQDFFNRAKYYHIEDKMLFVHGGFDHTIGIDKTSRHILVWDRELINHARENVIKSFDKVFVGHTTTQMIEDQAEPVQYNNLFAIDCGAGWDGKLCIINIHTNKYYLSEIQEGAGR